MAPTSACAAGTEVLCLSGQKVETGGRQLAFRATANIFKPAQAMLSSYAFKTQGLLILNNE